jgi:hypothetical protein
LALVACAGAARPPAAAPVVATPAELAAERFTLAARLDPQQARYYGALAQVYRVLNQPIEAEMVVTEGLKQAPVNGENRADLAAMALAAARFANTRHDPFAAQAWIDRAEMLADDVTPEFLYELAAVYSSVVVETTRDTAKAQRMLKQFVRRVCQGAAAKKYDYQCSATESMLQRLSYLDSVPGFASKP